jgi:iron complex outermembrane receptor protein
MSIRIDLRVKLQARFSQCWRAGFHSLLWPLISLVYVGCPVIGADLFQTPIHVNIAAGTPLDLAVIQLGQQISDQTGLHVGFATSSMRPQQTTQGLQGTLPAATALKTLLRGSGLTYELNDHMVRVVPIDQPLAANEHSFRLAEGQPTNEKNTTQFKGPQADSTNERPSDKGKREPATLEEIVVTAQKREERLIDTPQSVSVLSSEDLAKLAATQFRDFANTVPGLSFTTAGAGYTQLSMRGVTSGTDISPTVGIYIDEVPYGSSTAFASGSQLALDVGLFDVDRIEVLHGPQGTLYGASTMGGLIKYVSKRPNATTLGGDVQSGLSATHHGGVNYNVAAAVNAPILTDKAAVRASGFYSRDGGYIDNIALNQAGINRSVVEGGRIDLLLAPSEALSIRITGFLQNISRDGEAAADYTRAGAPVDSSLDQRRLFDEPFDQHFRLVSGTVGYDLGAVMLTSITSYQTSRTETSLDLSGAYAPLLKLALGRSYSAVGLPLRFSTNKFVQEVRLASEGVAPIEWLIGGFYTQEVSGNMQEFSLRDATGRPAPNDLFTYSTPTHYEEYAAFGDLTWHLTSKFDVSGGMRYARNEQRYTQIGSGLFGSSLPTTRSTDHVSTYLANMRYHFSDHATGYLRYATGYRPGGPNDVTINAITGLPNGSATFQPDRLKSYELGFKAETAERHFGLDLAVYDIDWSNIQINVIRGGFGSVANAPGGATVQGTELSLTARANRTFTVTGAFAYQHAYLKEADADLGAAKGERLPNVPRFTAALNADYELPVGTLQPTVGATLRYVSDRTASFDNSTSYPQYHLPHYTTLDLRTAFALSRVNVQLYVRNLFDERGQLSAATAYGAARVAILQPRTIGVMATANF